LLKPPGFDSFGHGLGTSRSADDDCGTTLDVSPAEYDEAHQQRDRFMVASGHEDEQIEHVVKRTPDYLIVDKFGEAERVAEAEERRQGSA